MIDAKSFKFSEVKNATLKSMIQNAYTVQKNAYAPYSKFSIGASILDSKGAIFTGCNVENSSYGGTVCAERVAIWKGVSEKMKLPLKAVVVVSSEKDQWPPCGLCRQVMAEFCTPQTVVFFGNNKKEFRQMTFAELLPEAFSNKFVLHPQI
ncbi:MAG: cytidine deaminase [Bdellovibrionaceae bacterium]|nr:cytidine deaminase [Pseudobdellovibrionaceae bacterium]